MRTSLVNLVPDDSCWSPKIFCLRKMLKECDGWTKTDDGQKLIATGYQSDTQLT